MGRREKTAMVGVANWIKDHTWLGPAIDAVKKLIDLIQKLIDKITGPLKDAFNTLMGPSRAIASASGVTSLKDARPDLFGHGHGGQSSSHHSAPAGPHGPTQRALGGPVSPGGMALVGERGPELVQFPFGAQVFDNHKTQSMISPDWRNLPPIVIPVNLDGQKIAESVVRVGESAKARK
jgi:hypothetical protein